MTQEFYEYIVEGAYQGVKKYGKEFVTKNGVVKFYYKPEGVDVDDRDSLAEADYNRLKYDDYFSTILKSSGPAAEVAWNLIYSHMPAGRTIEMRRSFILSNSWYVKPGVFFIINKKTRTKALCMLRISNHDPNKLLWEKHTGSENIWCLNILIGKDCTTRNFSRFPKTVTLRYPTAEDFYNDKEIANLVRDMAEHHKLTEIYGHGDYIFQKREERQRQPANKLIYGFSKRELKALRPFREDDRELQRYNRGIYTTPDGKDVKLYYTKDLKKAFYYEPPHMIRPANKKEVRVFESLRSINEAMQCLPVYNMDTQEYCIGNMYLEDSLFQIGCMSFFDVIYQLDTEKFNKFLQTVELKFEKKFIYNITQYYTNIQLFVEQEDVDGILRKAIVNIGRSLLNAILKKLRFDEEGKLKVYKKFSINDFMKTDYYTDWSEWCYDNYICEDDNIIAETTVDISDVLFDRTILYAIRCPELKRVFLNDAPKIEKYSTINGENIVK